MSILSRYSRFVVVAIVALALVGCRDDTKPKPGASGAPLGPQDKGKMRRARAAPKRISPEAMKSYRLEVCYFGTLGLRATRDAYLASLGGSEPGPGKIPAFGVPEPKTEDKDAKAEPSGKPAATTDPAAKEAARAATKDADKASGEGKIRTSPPSLRPERLPRPHRGRLPYARHIRSCAIANKLKKPPSPELDAATGRFEKYVSALHKLVGDAMRYYQRKEYEEDKFARGKELHGQLTESFGKLDEEIAAFEKAYQAWRADQKPPPDELDEGGELAEVAVAKARALTLLFWAKGDKDVEAIKKGIASVSEATADLDAHKEKDGKSMHARTVPSALKRFVDGAKLALEEVEAGKLSPAMLLEVTYRFVAVLEGNHRALARMLNPKGGRPLDSVRMKRPHGGMRPPLRRPPPAPAEKSAPE